MSIWKIRVSKKAINLPYPIGLYEYLHSGSEVKWHILENANISSKLEDIQNLFTTLEPASNVPSRSYRMENEFAPGFESPAFWWKDEKRMIIDQKTKEIHKSKYVMGSWNLGS